MTYVVLKVYIQLILLKIKKINEKIKKIKMKIKSNDNNKKDKIVMLFLLKT